jgi:putative restriction endonuclease
MNDPSSSSQTNCGLMVPDNWLPWLERLSALKQDMSRGAAPHKPLLLLVVLDLIEDGQVNNGFMAQDGNLAFRFSSYWTIVAERRSARPDVRLPFYHMKSDGFWTPLETSGVPAPSRATAAMARLDPSFLRCAMEPEFRTLSRRTLIAKYFEPGERATLYRLVGIEAPSDDVAAGDALRFQPESESEQKRDARFALRVLPAYDYTCARTRYRMMAVDGKTAVDAAHIHQFKKGGSNSPSNGIALSKTAHWLFDRGFWSITDDFLVMVRADSFEEAGELSHLLKPRVSRPILLPADQRLWPGQEFLAWHRQRHGFVGSLDR